MLRVEQLSQTFGTQRVLKDISFAIPKPMLTGLIGPGGSGKSTLLKLIAGLQHPDHGLIDYGNGPVEASAIRTNPSALSLMFQEGALFDSLTVYENVAFPLVSGKVPTVFLPFETQEQVNQRVSEILARVGLTKAATKYPAQLSGGMRKRASLARALVARPRFVMLDDPTAGLDPVASSVIMDLIVELYREYTPNTIIVSHDLRRLLPVVDEILALFDGEVRFHGRLEQLHDCDCHLLRKFISCRFDAQ